MPFAWEKTVGLICKRTASSLLEPNYRSFQEAFKEDRKSTQLLCELIFSILSRPYAQSRYLAVCFAERLLADYLVFRDVFFAGDLTVFFEKTVGLNRHALPSRPPSAAHRLKDKALSVLNDWQSLYAGEYGQIHVLHRYIFDHLQLNSLERARYFTIPKSEQSKLEKQQRDKVLLDAARKRLDRLENRLEREIYLTERFIYEANQLLQKIVPFGEANAGTPVTPEYLCDDGLPSVHYKLEITIDVQSMSSNFALCDSDKENASILCTKLKVEELPRVNNLIFKFEISMFPETYSRCQSLLSRLLLLRDSLILIQDKFKLLGVVPSSTVLLTAISDDEKFQEVTLQ